MTLYRLRDHGSLVAPTLVAAFDGWIDAGGASTAAAERLSEGGDLVATFDADILFDYRARRPTLDIVDGRLSQLTWPELAMRKARLGDHDLLILTGAEPDFHWQELADDIVELIGRLGVGQWISLGAIPAAVPHTRPVPIIGSASGPGVLRGGVQPGPEGRLRVPSAAISVLEMAVAGAGLPAVGYYAQVPHYVSGPYALAALELLRALGRHFDVEIEEGALGKDARILRGQLDAATEADETTRKYVARLESMVDESRLPSGDELISDIERFLRERGGEGTQRS
ncbi:MAG TPA: PAC2 family protein [Candidatus Limnocylindrales bacterium]